MKKIITLTSILALAACGTSYHTGKIGMTISNPYVEFIPQEAHVDVDTSKKITGSAECTSHLWIFDSAPLRQAYGAGLQTTSGLTASGDCVAAAMYEAIKQTDADIIVAPQYTMFKDGFLCLGNRCFNGTTKVIVKGYAGKITAIKDMDRSVVQERQKPQK